MLAVLPVYLLVLAGALFRRTGLLRPEHDDGIMRVVYYVMLPCFMLDKILGAEVLRSGPAVGWAMVLGCGLILAGLVIAWVVARWALAVAWSATADAWVAALSTWPWACLAASVAAGADALLHFAAGGCAGVPAAREGAERGADGAGGPLAKGAFPAAAERRVYEEARAARGGAACLGGTARVEGE